MDSAAISETAASKVEILGLGSSVKVSLSQKLTLDGKEYKFATYEVTTSGSYTISARAADSAESAWSDPCVSITKNIDVDPPTVVINSQTRS